MNVTYVAIKPSTRLEGTSLIFEMLRKLHLDRTSRIVNTRVWLPPEKIRALYPGSPIPILEKTVEEMSERLSVMRFSARFESADIVKRIAAIRGANINPALCELGTLRREVFEKIGCIPVQLERGYTYYPNFAHVPQDEAEAELCDLIFGDYFSVGA